MNAGCLPGVSKSRFNPVVVLQDQKATGTDGGAFVSGAWRTRDLNTKVADTHNICVILGNQFSLPAGTYAIFAKCPASYVGGHKAKLFNASDGTDILLGTAEFSGTANASENGTSSFIIGVFTITATKTFEIRHYCQTTNGTYGFGDKAGAGVSEVYTTVRIEKIA